MWRSFFLFILICFTTLFCDFSHSVDIDEEDNVVFQAGINHQQLNVGIAKPRRYLLYDVNPGEGFNLRRDVYMRVATLVAKLNTLGKDDWVLVLSPWGRIYHWKSSEIGPQIRLPWSLFFDLNSLQKYVNVIEFDEFLAESNIPQIEKIYYLQNYAEGWRDGKWEERMDEQECNDSPVYQKKDGPYYQGWFWSYENVVAGNFTCLSIQGQASTLIPLLTNISLSSIMIDRAEVILHDTFGDPEYWKVRRSMRFASHLIKLGNDFREKFLNSSDDKDKTILTEDWRKMKKKSGSAKGGPYLAVHLRRADFLYGRKNELPSLRFAAKQIMKKLEELNITKVFIATDSSAQELDELKRYLRSAQVYYYVPSNDVKKKYKDGGIAIIDQWICAHARYFIGTHESTFSFRIQEEREILGFDSDSTFNRLCPDKKTKCEQPSRWKIAY